jgi:hypothetical protein
MPASLCMFECFLEPGHRGGALLTAETMKDTGATVMTDAEAEAVGFGGLPANDTGAERRLVVCRQTDMRRIHQAIESNPAIASFRMHEIDG